MYLIGWIILLFSVLVYVDSGAPVPRFMRFSRHMRRGRGEAERRLVGEDVMNEENRVANSKDELRVLQVSKAFRGSQKKAVDDVSFGISKETFTILGPNGMRHSFLLKIRAKAHVTPRCGKDDNFQRYPYVISISLPRVSLGHAHVSHHRRRDHA